MRILALIITSLLIISCNNASKKQEAKVDKKMDSLLQELSLTKKALLEIQHKDSIEKKAIYYNEDFNSFFYNFMTDTTFQKSRIKFPLEYHTTDIDTMKDTIITIHENEWKHNSFYFYEASERTQIYDNYDLKFVPSNERLLHWYGIESGGDSRYYFKGFKQQWYLVKKWDSGV